MSLRFDSTHEMPITIRTPVRNEEILDELCSLTKDTQPPVPFPYHCRCLNFLTGGTIQPFGPKPAGNLFGGFCGLYLNRFVWNCTLSKHKLQLCFISGAHTLVQH